MSTPETPPQVSIVIPTRDRPDSLARCLDAILDPPCDTAFEVLVVNDAGKEVGGRALTDPRVTVLQAQGRGPAAARNIGIAAASAPIVLFTDDDAVAEPGWVDAAARVLRDDPRLLGVAGRVTTDLTNPLYQRTVGNRGGTGPFLTCNIAYRTDVLRQVDGFDEGFPYPHAEDRDLGARVTQLGEVAYADDMVVFHPVHPLTLRDVVRRARYVESDWRLYHKHPDLRPPRWSTRWATFTRGLGRAPRLARFARPSVGGPTAPFRLVLVVTVRAGAVAWYSATRWRSSRRRLTAEHPPRRRGMRIAFLGDLPRNGAGGVSEAAFTILGELAARGCEVDCFAVLPASAPDEGSTTPPGVRIIGHHTGWRFGKWYSRNDTTKLLTGLLARAFGRRQLVWSLLEQHEFRPYDVVYQFSTIERFGARRAWSALPPVVVHPSTSIAGELKSLRGEQHLARQCEPAWRRLVVRALLEVRTRRQRRDIQRAQAVISISEVFRGHLIADYGLEPQRVTTVPYPISVPAPAAEPPSLGPEDVHVLMISRVSTRKGIDVLVDLSHRLADLRGRLRVHLVGGNTQWSDYRRLLTSANPDILTYHGSVRHPVLMGMLRRADVLIAPSSFEPFGLVVAEALACGVPVVATDEVGAAEHLTPECCVVVPAGDAAAFEAALRALVARLEAGEGPAIARLAQQESLRRFAPDLVAGGVLDVLRTCATSGRAQP